MARGYRAILGHRSFLALGYGQLVSQSGDSVLGVALLWLVRILTGSALYTGWTAAAELAPSLLIAPLAGVYVDRLDRRDLLITTMTLQRLVAVGLASLFMLP